VAYLLRARTVEPQKQQLIRNNGVMQSVSRQRLGKHTYFRVSDRPMQRGDVIKGTDSIFRGVCAERL
jgi:hypothetical protein